MKEAFGTLPNGGQATLYTISCGSLRAAVTDYGATLVRLYVPDRSGKLADVVLGLSEAADYAASDACLGSTVGRNANRMKNAQFDLWGKTVQLPRNEGNNNLHSGPDGKPSKKCHHPSDGQPQWRSGLPRQRGDPGDIYFKRKRPFCVL